MRARWAVLVAFMAFGCGDEEAPELEDTVEFATGEFRISTNTVVDECLDLLGRGQTRLRDRIL